jgi:hypothetical protein
LSSLSEQGRGVDEGRSEERLKHAKIERREKAQGKTGQQGGRRGSFYAQ